MYLPYFRENQIYLRKKDNIQIRFMQSITFYYSLNSLNVKLILQNLVELLTLPEHLRSPPVYNELVSCYSIFSFLCSVL